MSVSVTRNPGQIVVNFDVLPAFIPGVVDVLAALAASGDQVVAEAVSRGSARDADGVKLVLEDDPGLIRQVLFAARSLAGDASVSMAIRVRALDVTRALEKIATPVQATRSYSAAGRPSGLLYPMCGVDLTGATSSSPLRKEAKAIQKKLWIDHGPPSAPPVEYQPGAVLDGSFVGPKDDPASIPESYGDPDLRSFDKIVILFSGGKDSLACLFYVVDLCRKLGISVSHTVEAWHHAVDGRPARFGGSGTHTWDWPVTESYCELVCKAVGVPLYFSWKEGGITREMLRDEALTAPKGFQMPDGSVTTSGGVRGELNTRMSFPKIGSIDGGRWCSSVVKIDVGRSYLRSRKDLFGKRVLLVGGERAEESPNRAMYSRREFDKNAGHGDRERHVEAWRPIHLWCEIDVWGQIARHKIRVHPAYRIGWGRLSCMTCIFGNPRQWASIREIDPDRWEFFVKLERRLLKRREADLASAQGDADAIAIIRKRRLPLVRKDEPLPQFIVDKKTGEDAKPYDAAMSQPQLVKIALSGHWSEDPIMNSWELPSGAFGDSAGPS